MTSSAGFQSVREYPEERQLSIQGVIPEWLEGVLFRTGPGRFEVGEMKVNHWFDGKALNHRFAISGSRASVSYRSRFACSDQIAKEEQNGYSKVPTFSQPYDPCERLYTKFKTAFQTVAQANGPSSSSDANINVVLRFDHQHRTLVTTTDTVAIQHVDPTTLEPIKVLSFPAIGKRLSGHLAAAHAATIDGIRYNFILEFGPRITYKLFSIDEQGKVRVLRRITDAPGAYLHSLAATQNYVVLTVWQADIGGMGLGIVWKNNVLENIKRWSPQRKTVHYVVNRHTGDLVSKSYSDVFFCFHHINAYETDDGGEIVLDLCTFKDTGILNYLKVEQARKYDVTEAPLPEYRRIVLPLNGTSDTTLKSRKARVDIGMDLPVVSPSRRWRKARYAYGIHHTTATDSRHMFVDALIKLDLDSAALDDERQLARGTDFKVWRQAGCVPGEPIFVQRPGGSDEDDGVLLTVALDVTTQASSLNILDARSMTTIATAKLDVIFPFGFHGTFVEPYE